MPPQKGRAQAPPQKNQSLETTYTSDPVDIPHDFLLTTPSDAQPITISPINFADSELPEYAGCTALVLDNVLSPSECATLLALAESSATSSSVWRPAMINVGMNREIMAAHYRNSDRIIWDSKDMVERVWARCLKAEGLWEVLAKVERQLSILGRRPVERKERWRFTRLNERMRFLKYGPGQFFQAHCDGSYVNPDAIPMERSLVTLQLYLNHDESLKGGATSFHPMKEVVGQIDVLPKTGRVLIFQHRGLLHSGQEVTSGVKYTMRTDLMYQLMVDE